MNRLFWLWVIVLLSSVRVGASANDSLLHLLQQDVADTTRLKIYVGLAKGFMNSNLDSALNYAERGYSLSKELKRVEEQGQAANILGVIYMNRTRHELSLAYHTEAVGLFKSNGNDRGVAFAYNNMGSVYFHLKNYDEALRYYQLSLSLKLQLKLLKEASSTYINIGNIYMKKLRYDSSAYFYNEGLSNARKNNDTYNEAIALMNLGEVAYVSKEYTKALSYFNAALKYINANQKDRYHVANCYYAIGKIYGDTKRFDQAEKSILKALEIAKESGARLLEINIYRYLSQLYEQANDIPKAYTNFKKFHTLNDSIFNSENLKQIEEIKQKYESELKDQELLEKEIRLQREQTLRNSFILGFILIAVICIVLYRNVNLKKKANALLSQHQIEIELHQQEIERKNDELNEINIELIKENVFTRYEILKNKVNPHFLFNSLSTLSYLILKDSKKALDFVESFSKLYRTILEVENNQLVSLQEELKIVEEYLKLQRIRYAKNLNVEMEIDPNLLKHVLPPFSVQLLVENALKHNSITQEQQLQLILRTKDSRIEVLNSIQKKTFSEPSTGVGQKNIIDRYKLFTDLTPLFEEKDGMYIASIPLIAE